MSYLRRLLIIPFAWTLSAQAHIEVPNLWQEAKAQENWRNVTIEIPGLEGKITAVLTDAKKVRFENFGSPLRASGTLESSVWGLFNSRERFRSDCHLLATVIDRVRAKKNPYLLSFPTVPLQPDFVTVVHQDGRQELLRGPANEFKPIGWFKVDIELRGAATVLRTGLDLELLKYELMGQLNANKAAIAAEGQIELDLTGYDDVACDLLNKRLNISVTVNSHYSAARLTRTPLFKLSEVERLHSDLTDRSATFAPGGDPRIMMPAYLGISLQELGRDMDQLAAWEFERLYSLLVDRVSGKLQDSARERLAQITNAMDRLEQTYGWSNPVYHVDVSGAQEAAADGEAN